MKVILRTTGPRKPVDLPEAAEIVDKWTMIAEGNEVVGVDLSCRPWPIQTFLHLKEFLTSGGRADSVQYLKVDDIIASLKTDEGLEVTQQVAETFAGAKIIELDLNDNAMGPRGFGRIGPLLNNSPLQVLSLNNCGLDAHCMDMLVDYISADDVSILTTACFFWLLFLRSFFFLLFFFKRTHQTGLSFFIFYQHQGRIAKTLRELHLGRNKIGDGTETIGKKILPQLVSLERFSYRGSRSGNQAIHLARGLHELVNNCTGEPPLRHIDLDDGNFGPGTSDDDAIFHLANALCKCRYLQHLDLGDPEFGSAGLELLVTAFKTSGAKITELLLNGAGELGEVGADILADWLVSRASTIKRLHLGFCELGNAGASAVLVPFFASQNVLEDLSLECNELDNEFVDTLLMARLPNLKTLNLSDNMDIDDEEKQEQLREKFGAQTVLFDVEEES
jgi:Ran GTPase-activating protein (RanGAP) involved in mRNA processing and transport